VICITVPLEKVDNYTWRIPIAFKKGMRVPGVVFADEFLLRKMLEDLTLVQCANVAFLPGIYKYSITLPDGHQGYGFPIGGVAAIDADEGVISPGGVGYDINCGVRLVRTDLERDDIKKVLPELLNVIFKNVPSGVGSEGKLRFSITELDKALIEGVDWAISKGYGWPEDKEYCEENGCMKESDPSKVSNRAKQRGAPQLGTLGAGNHFLEIQYVEKIYNLHAAKVFGITHEGQVTIMIHTGSRGFGHQVCSDYLKVMEHAVRKYNIYLPDRELACAPAKSNEAENYFAAMAAAANYAWINRQCILHWIRESFEEVFKTSAEKLGLYLVYDVAHNIAKLETHEVSGGYKKVFVHRKGATRAFPKDHPDIPAKHRSVGQAIILPGSMGSASYLLLGDERAMKITFGSTAHGAGRMMSREEAIRKFSPSRVENELRGHGILIKAASKDVISEEAPLAYKDIDKVAEVSHKVGIGTLVCRLVPLGVVKG
jgi:tRNA-splicing ligase RtcB